MGCDVPDCRRAAELDARDYPGAFHRVAFHGADGPVYIETTRPELIAACVALIAHPDDERYRPLLAAQCAARSMEWSCRSSRIRPQRPDKGTGIAMCCTFGDLTDVTWWRELQLPARVIIGRDGRICATGRSGLMDDAPGMQLPEDDHLRSRAVVLQLRTSGDLDGEADANAAQGQLL